MPGIDDLSDIATDAEGVAKIVLESVQEMLLKLALQVAEVFMTIAHCAEVRGRLTSCEAVLRGGL